MNIYDELFVLSFDILSLYCNKVLCWIPTISLSVWKTIKTHHLTIKKKNTSLLWKTTIFAGFSLPVLPPVLSGLAQDVWFLSPGIGAQGGDLAAALQAGLRKDGLGILLPISRGGSTCGELWVFVMFSSKSQQEAAENSTFAGILGRNDQEFGYMTYMTSK